MEKKKGRGIFSQHCCARWGMKKRKIFSQHCCAAGDDECEGDFLPALLRSLGMRKRTKICQLAALAVNLGEVIYPKPQKANFICFLAFLMLIGLRKRAFDTASH